MIPEAMLSQLTFKKDIPTELAAKMYEEGFLTGSYIFGGFVEGSDIDIVVPPTFCVQDIAEFMVYFTGIYREDGDFGSYYVTIGGSILNVLAMNTLDSYETWERATKDLLLIKKSGIDLTEKNFRVSLFEALKRREKV
jgi:hypothetical protein